jgi:hypothetical protein
MLSSRWYSTREPALAGLHSARKTRKPALAGIKPPGREICRCRDRLPTESLVLAFEDDYRNHALRCRLVLRK